jgi:HK97 family phage major capsid protein
LTTSLDGDPIFEAAKAMSISDRFKRLQTVNDRLEQLGGFDRRSATQDAEYKSLTEEGRALSLASLVDDIDTGRVGHESGSEPGASDRAVTVGVKGAARRVIDAAAVRHKGAVPDDAFQTVTALVERPDPQGWAARWATVTGDPHYETAFAKLLADPDRGHLTWTAKEADAYRKVAAFGAEVKAMGLSDTTGGFLVPLTLDPAVLLTSAGSVNPLRQIARVDTTVTDQKAFVTSAGVTAEWLSEAAEAADAAPTVAQPNVPVHKGAAFVPFSYEVGMDAVNLPRELGPLLTDAADQLQAVAYTTGTGTGQPRGIITALVAAGGATVIATGTNVLAQADLYNNQAALPARWRPRARWMMNLSIINGYRQLPQATGLNYSIVNDDGPIPKALGWQIHENSSMDGTLTGAAADYLVLSGDFRQFAIVDRVGTTVEVIPNLVGPNRRPTGQRGLFMWFRTGSDVLVADAFRLSNFST